MDTDKQVYAQASATRGFNEGKEPEHVIYSTRKHWIIFWAPTLSILSFYVSAFTGVLVNKTFGLIIANLIASILYTLIFLILLYHHWRAAYFSLTNKRIRMSAGQFKVKSLNIRLAKVKDMKVIQGPVARFFSYGTISVRNSRGMRVNFMFVSHPVEFRERVQEQIDKMLENEKEIAGRN